MLNRITITGRLTHDPELRTTQSNISVTSFSIACQRNFKNGNGERETDFFDVTAWRSTAEFITRYSLFLSLLFHIRLPSGISAKGYETSFHIPACLPHLLLRGTEKTQTSDRSVHNPVHRFFCNISALLPGFLLLNSTHKPEPVPYAPSPSCIQLDAIAFSL